MDEERMKARTRYVTGFMSLKQLAEETGLSAKKLGNWCRKEGWVKARADFQQRTVKRAKNRVDRKGKALCRLVEASDEYENTLLLAAQTFSRKINEDEDGEILTDGKNMADNLIRIGKAISQQAETRMLLSGFLKDGKCQENQGVSLTLDKEAEELSE